MRIQVLRWEIDALPEVTRQAYAKRGRAGPEECGCLYCRNFAAARPLVYPPLVLDIFRDLGVEPVLEAEVMYYDELRPGVHLYGGVLHVAGKLLSGTDATRWVRKDACVADLADVSDAFRLGVTADLVLVPDAFRGLQLLQLEFSADVPWVLAEPCSG